jgi:cytochrome c2
MIGVKEQQDLLLSIARELKKHMTVYAVGGTAMMFYGFKDTTKDIDLVFTNNSEKNEFKECAEKLGYNNYNAIQVYGTKPNQPIMLARGKGKEERFDLFSRNVIDFYFSENMIQRSKNKFQFDKNLLLKIADPHDIILMKCATDRLKDKEDAKDIIQNYEIEWNIILDESKQQLKEGKYRAVWEIPQFLMELKKLGINMDKDIINKFLKLLEESSSEKQQELNKFIDKSKQSKT